MIFITPERVDFGGNQLVENAIQNNNIPNTVIGHLLVNIGITLIATYSLQAAMPHRVGLCRSLFILFLARHTCKQQNDCYDS